jgi:PAS domain S-box-containing protein
LRVRLLLAYTLVFTVVMAVSAAWIYRTFYLQTMRGVTGNLVEVLNGAASGVDAAELQALVSSPVALRADGYPDDARYWRQAQWLAAVHAVAPRTRPYLYRAGAAPGQIAFILGQGQLAPGPAGGKFLEPWAPAPGEPSGGLLQGLITTTIQAGPGPAGSCAYYTQDCVARPYQTAQGLWVSVFTPITNAQGQVVAGLGIDRDARDIEAARQVLIQTIVLIGLAAYAVTIALLYLASVLMARPAQRLAQAVKQFGQGRAPETLVAAGPFTDEISTLADVIRQQKLLETALRESEARYRLMADNLEDVIWTATSDARFTYVSPSVARQRGFTPEEVMAEPAARAVASPEAAAALLAELARRVAALEGGDESARVQVHQVEQTRKDGSTVMTEIVTKLITDAHGRVVEILGITRDITERVQMEHARRVAEDALRESEERFRRIFEMAPLGAAVQELDFRFSRVNEALCRMLGYSSDELLTLSFPQVTHPDDVDENRAQAARLLRGELDQYVTEKRYLRKDGSVVWALVWVRLLRSSAGEPLHFLPLVYDLTERRQAESAQRAAEQRYRAIFEGAVEGIFQSAPDGRYLNVNPAMARIFGYASPEEMMALVGSDIAHRIHADPQTRADFVRWMDLEGEVREFEARNLRKDGSLIWTRTNARVVRDESGAVAYYEGFLEEITDRKTAEDEVRRLNADLEQRVGARTAELRQANVALTQALRVKAEFLSMMSHELRTPLANILGLAQVLGAQVYGPLNRKQVGTLDDLQACGQQLLELIGDVLDFASAEAGGLPLDVKPVEVGPLVQAAVRAVTPSATRKELRVTIDRDVTVTTVPADARRLRQMLLHLLNNAVKFTPAGGALGVEVALSDYTAQREVRFTVWDTGIGVAPADQERIFEPFVQLDSRLSRQYSGSGLGLSVVRRLAELHGGRVAVESEGMPGRGCRFSIYLPWSPPAP